MCQDMFLAIRFVEWTTVIAKATSSSRKLNCTIQNNEYVYDGLCMKKRIFPNESKSKSMGFFEWEEEVPEPEFIYMYYQMIYLILFFFHFRCLWFIDHCFNFNFPSIIHQSQSLERLINNSMLHLFYTPSHLISSHAMFLLFHIFYMHVIFKFS